MVLVLYGDTIQLKTELDLIMTRFLAFISLYLAKVIKHNKSNTVFLHDIFVIVSSFYLSEITYVIRVKNFELIPDATVTPRITDHVREKQYAQH